MESRRVNLIKFPVFDDGPRGSLAVAEAFAEIPFVIYRAFWIWDVAEWETRGGHAHDSCHQVLVAMSGSVSIYINETKRFVLNNLSEGLYIPPGNAITMQSFSRDCVLMVLCSERYNADEYIYSFAGFATEELSVANTN